MSNPDLVKRVALALDELSQALLASIDDGVSSTGQWAQPQAAPQPAPQPVQAAPAPASAGFPGNCPVHNLPFTTVKADGSPAKRAFCKNKVRQADGTETWCEEKGPWLNSR
jgi:hypothetical protein